MAPSISVILPVYNGELFLREAIESILHQSYADFELIVINDGSTDNSEQIIKEYTASDHRIEYKPQVKNSGLIECLNLGLSLAKGKYIARMDADDISLPNRFQLQKEFLDSHPDIGVVGSNVHVIDRSGHRISNFINNPRLPETPNQIRWALCFSSGLLHPTVMTRREILVKAEGYDISALHAEDYDLWTRISPITNFHNLRKKLLLLRRHNTNVTVVYKDTSLENSLRISKKYISSILNDDFCSEVLTYLWTNKGDQLDDDHNIKTFFDYLRLKFEDSFSLRYQDKVYISNDICKRLITIALTKQKKRFWRNKLFVYSLNISVLATIENLLVTLIRILWKQLKRT